jgi:hypothetical protein
MSTTNKDCYETSPQILFTEFQTETEGAYLLAYSALLFGHLPPSKSAENANDVLTLIYVTHTVVIKGSNLSSLLERIQSGSAKKIFIGGEPSSTDTKFPAVTSIRVAQGVEDRNPL